MINDNKHKVRDVDDITCLFLLITFFTKLNQHPLFEVTTETRQQSSNTQQFRPAGHDPLCDWWRAERSCTQWNGSLWLAERVWCIPCVTLDTLCHDSTRHVTLTGHTPSHSWQRETFPISGCNACSRNNWIMSNQESNKRHEGAIIRENVLFCLYCCTACCICNVLWA